MWLHMRTPPIVTSLPAQPAPFERMGARAATLGRRAILVGGFDYPSHECLREVGWLDEHGCETEAGTRLTVGRNHFEMTPLDGHRLLVIGGYSEDYGSLADVECLDLRHQESQAWPWLKAPVELFNLVLLPGEAAVIGGLTAQGATATHDEIQLIDLRTHEVRLNPEPLRESRFGSDALWLPRLGKVLIAGGKHVDRIPGAPQTTTAKYTALGSLELWDPKTGHVQRAGVMTTPRDRPRLYPLPDGRVVILGGASDSKKLDSIEVYDPVSQSTQVVGHLTVARMAPMILPYRDQGLLIAGGWVDAVADGANIEFLNFADMRSSVVGRAVACRAEGAMIWVKPDTFVLAGGKDAFKGRNPHEYRFSTTEAFRVEP